MKRKVPRFRRKVQGIPGDCMLPGLGLTSADKTMLVKNVSTKHIRLNFSANSIQVYKVKDSIF